MWTREDFIDCIKRGHRPAYHLFYGGPLSQWAPSPFVLDGKRYPTAEHWMMAEKARTFGDEVALAAIMATEDPAVAKVLGRAVVGYDDEVWSECRQRIVYEGNMAKFQQNPEYARYLLATNQQVLVEASGDDRIWGVGFWEDDPRAADPLQWQGENLLGFALMEVRATVAQWHRERGGGGARLLH